MFGNPTVLVLLLVSVSFLLIAALFAFWRFTKSKDKDPKQH